MPKERRRSRIRLTVSTVEAPNAEEALVGPTLPGAATGALVGLGAAFTGWALVTGFCLVAWFTVMELPLPTVLRFATQFFLAGHGAGATVGDRTITLIPLGLTLLSVLMVRSLATWALRHDAAQRDPVALRTSSRWLASALVVGYGAITGLASLASGSSGRVFQAILGGLIVAALGTGWAFLKERGTGKVRIDPWLRRLPSSVGVGLAALAGAGMIVLVVGLILGWSRVTMLNSTVGFDAVGQLLWFVVMLAYLPNILAACASFSVGAGFGVGAQTVVSPGLTQVGLLPAIPVLGAIPPNGPGSVWSYGWLGLGVLVGALVGLWQLRQDPERALLQRLLRAVTAGLATAGAFVLLAAASGGDLGAVQLVGLGPRLPELSWLASLPLVIAPALAALIEWALVVRHLPPLPSPDDTTVIVDRDEVETVPLGR